MKTPPFLARALRCVVCILLLTLTLSPLAAQSTWNGGTDSLWGEASNWTPNGVPDSATLDLTFGDVTNQTIDLNAATFRVGDLTFTAPDDYSIANGTINLNGTILSDGTAGPAATFTIGANLNLGSAERTIDEGIGTNGGIIQLAGDITGGSGVGILYSAAGRAPLVITGSNSMTGDFKHQGRYLRVGSNSALGTGKLILGKNEDSLVPSVSSNGTSAWTISNEVSLNNGIEIQLGDATNNGKLTFTGTAVIDQTFNLATTEIEMMSSDAEFSAGIFESAGNLNRTLSVIGHNNAVLTLGGASNRTGVTSIGPNVRVKAVHSSALGSGEVQLAGGALVLGGGVSLSNGITATVLYNGGASAPLLISDSGHNTISGQVRINGSDAAVLTYVEVVQDTLTLSGGIVGASGTSNNYFAKSGAGTVVLSGATGTGIAGLRIVDGALHAGGSALTATQRLQFTGAGGTTTAVYESNGTFTRNIASGAGAVYWFGPSNGGFAAQGGTFDIRLNNGTAAVTWGAVGFVQNGTLIFGSLTADNRVNFQNALNLGAAGTPTTREIRVVDNTDSAEDYAQISGVISGAADKTLSKTGAGRLELTAVNTYSGATTITAGTLVLSGAGSINNSAVTVNGGEFRNNSSANYTGALTFTNGTVGGTNLNGSLGGLTIGTGQTVSPGNSPGTAATTSQTWAGGGSYLWEINNATGNAGADPGWDLLTGTGALSITATSGNKFTILVTSLTLSNQSGAAANFNGGANAQWLMADFTGAIGFDASVFGIDTSAFTNSFTGAFGLARGDATGIGGDNSQLYVTYTVPEPSAAWLLLGAAGFMGVRFLRRGRRV